MTARTYVEAVRQALLLYEDDDLDMRGVAELATRLLGEGKVVEAAISYLTPMARREYNSSLPVEDGYQPSGELVYVAGEGDVPLGNTEIETRTSIADSRDSLAHGLARSASRLRNYAHSAAGQSRYVSFNEVKVAERQAHALTNLHQALADLISAGEGDLDRDIAKAEEELAEEQAQADRSFKALSELQARMKEDKSLLSDPRVLKPSDKRMKRLEESHREER